MLLAERSGHGRFGFVVLLKFFQYEGRFPVSRREIPADVMCYLATQLRMPLNSLDNFDWRERTVTRQRAAILERLGIRRMEELDWNALAIWLDAEVHPNDPSLEQLIERTAKWLRTQQLDAPSADRLGGQISTECCVRKPMRLKSICSS